MPFFYADRIRDSSTTTGTGAVTLAGSPPQNYNALSGRYSVGDTFDYLFLNGSVAEWECGRGRVIATNQFARDIAWDGSGGTGVRVNFSAGTKTFAVVLAGESMQRITQRAVSVAMGGTLVLLVSDDILLVSLSGGSAQGSASCTLPVYSLRGGSPLTFKDANGSCSGSVTLNILAAGGDTIDGATSFQLNAPRQAITLNPYNDGVNTGWFIT